MSFKKGLKSPGCEFNCRHRQLAAIEQLWESEHLRSSCALANYLRPPARGLRPLKGLSAFCCAAGTT